MQAIFSAVIAVMSCRLEEAVTIRTLLQRNTEEITGVLRGLNGEYILPEAGGDLLRDGAGVLPTGAALFPRLSSRFVVCSSDSDVYSHQIGPCLVTISSLESTRLKTTGSSELH